MSREDDRVLRFYNEVLGLDHLHYGIWNKEDELTLSNLKEAQLRYENFLIDRLPSCAQKILDVGCGTSAMTQRLLSMGLEVHGLSPDETQKNNFIENLDAPFYHCRFEDFEPGETFDCLVMSESAQYIPYEQVFTTAKKSLSSGGHLMICDYFVLDNARGIMAKSGHNLTRFRAESAKRGFKLIEERDLTEKVAKTLDLGNLLAHRLLTGLDILTGKTRKRHPLLTRLAFRLLRKKWENLKRERELLDSEKFKAQKRYLFLLYKLPESTNSR